MPPQTPSVSDDSFNAFMGLDDNGKKTALASMPDNVKQALLGRINQHQQDLQAGGKAAATSGNVIRPRTMRDTIKEATEKGLSWLPSVGGAVGGMTGGVPGAALGGVAGKAAQRLGETAIYGKDVSGQTPGQALGELGTAGVEQGAMEGAGKVLGKGFKEMAGPAGERIAARPLNRMLRSTETTTFPGDVGSETVGAVLAKEPLPTWTGLYGMKDAIRKRVNFHLKALDQTAADLTQKGTLINLQKPIGDSIGKAAKVLSEADETKAIGALADLEKRLTTEQVPNSFVAGPNGKLIPLRVSKGLDKMTPTDAIKFRRWLDDYIALPGSSPGLKAYLQDVRDSIGDTIHNEAPDLAPIDKKISKMITGEQAMQGRIRHVESGTTERTAGSSRVDKLLDKTLPTRTTPGYMIKSKVLGAAQKGAKVVGGGPKRQGALKQVPRIVGVTTGIDENDEE